LHDPKLNGDCPVAVAWFFIRLLAMLENTKSRDGCISLDQRGLNFCAAREQHRHALRIARAGAARGLYALSVDGVQTLITVPKWAEVQGHPPPKVVPRGEERRGEETRGEREASSPPPAPESSVQTVDTVDTFDPLPDYLAARETATPEKPVLWRAASQLNRKHYPGSKEEKLRWVYENEDVIVATAVGEVLKAGGVLTRQSFNAKLLELLHRYFQHEFVERKPRSPRFESFEQARERAGEQFWDDLKRNGYQWEAA